MAIDIRPISRDTGTLNAMERVGLACFGESYVAERRLVRVWECSNGASLFLGAFDGERLVAYMGFLPYPAWIGEQDCLAHQAVHGATDPEYRGQGLFSRLAQRGMDLIPGEYLFGYPNSQAFPIWKDRLRFNVAPHVRIWLPCRLASPFVDSSILATALRDDRLCRIDSTAAAQVKMREKPGQIFEHDHGGTYIWGRIRTRSIGPAQIRFLDAGGCEITEPKHFSSSLARLGNAARVTAVRFVCTEPTALAKSGRVRLPVRQKWLVWAPLRPGLKCKGFEAFSGVADTW